ncbi:MAG TPA: DUF58 domain-containing protein [Hyphomicrobiaceae bacterium]|nr:DUF58 domain-containing protein [Hyphomicrobiaceae bacterium]
MAGQSYGSSSANDGAGVFSLEGQAHALADRLPDLMLEALRVANTVTHGIHGRRRAGTGETFWQFRQFQGNDPATVIDWRRSASSDHLYVREREWEAAHTFWLWPDLSPSMQFRSHLASVSKRDRALVLMLATAELLVRAGERVALLGLTQPMTSRRATSRMAETLAAHFGDALLQGSLPPPARLSRFSSIMLFSDFLDPPEVITQRLNEMAENNVAGHLVQVLDPAEETLAYEGRVEFRSPEGADRWIADRVETLRPEYQRRLQAHRAQLQHATQRIGWSFLVHHTDRPATEPLLAFIMRLQGMTQDYRWKPEPLPPEPAGGAL